MPLFVSTLLISVAAVWLTLDQVVRRKFRRLKSELPVAYLAAASDGAGASEMDASELAGGALMPLAVDLMRGRHGHIPIDALTPAECRVVLFAYAINVAPGWMVRYATAFLPRANRSLIHKLRQIHQSRPAPKVQYFGHLHLQQRLRSTPKV